MSAPEHGSDVAFAAVNAAFGSLGRVCMALDDQFRVRHVSSRLDVLLGEGAAARTVGTPVEALLGAELFGEDGPIRQALLGGEKREGWRALLRAGDGASHLLSVTAAPLQLDPHGVCARDARYLVVLRPAEEEVGDAAAALATTGIISRSRAMGRVMRLVESLQYSEASVLVTGESGSGKEVLARLVHAHSPRRSGPFVAVNAAALPGDLLESELFGHVRGAFTGATRDRPGRFAAAAQGTLFLDEVGDLPLHLQVKLLRVLQEHTYERVGENQPRRAEARIIAATNRDLRRAVAEGTFREDLYYRLRVFPVELPPLRERREDIEPMAQLLLSRVCARAGRAVRFSPDALRALMSHSWPGNVRELENALEFGVTVCRGQTLQPEDLPPEVLAGRTPEHAPARAVEPADAHDRATIEAALQAHRWSRAEAARALGLSRSTLWRRMRSLNIG
ncbi:sigma-54-dependent Fis family transcriptional regulator [Anaeromyxobacter sp. PSR-1]|uniref:sigma-54 interaction domain-containing protein n=1 Tax=unclassified Anaeromyxobacter TaxID=2620896 RepID=UPI0005DE502C|nr:sigma-54 dependent transcriptional regulator [Anaeromyxobacter sp. PSR-1]GAO03704.1 nif-specific regulatory protein [Anaeromyxobacter sp. PSR-1]